MNNDLNTRLEDLLRDYSPAAIIDAVIHITASLKTDKSQLVAVDEGADSPGKDKSNR